MVVNVGRVRDRTVSGKVDLVGHGRFKLWCMKFWIGKSFYLCLYALPLRAHGLQALITFPFAPVDAKNQCMLPVCRRCQVFSACSCIKALHGSPVVPGRSAYRKSLINMKRD